MIGKSRRDLRILELSTEEKRLLIRAMIWWRNKLIAVNKPTEDVNSILLRLL